MDKRDLKQEETEHQTETQNSHRHHPYHKRGILEKNRTPIRQLGTSLILLKCDKKLTLQNPKFALCLKILQTIIKSLYDTTIHGMLRPPP